MAGPGQQVRTRTESSISKKVWRDYKDQMKHSLNVAIFPFLMQYSLIPVTDSRRYVDSKTTEVEKLDIIIDSVPRSGHPDYVLKFSKCLRDSSQEAGQAHEELAVLLETAYNKYIENETGVSISLSVTTVTMLDVETGSSTGTQAVRDLAGQYCRHDLNQDPVPSSIYLFKKYWKWIFLHSSAFLWLLLGAILSVILTQVPPINENQPTLINGKPNILIDLGIDPFWVSSASFSTSISCSGSTMYVVKGSVCEQLPKIHQELDQDGIADPIFIYLLPGSAINITVKQRDNLENVEIWILQSIANYMRRSSLSCDHPLDRTWCYRANEYAGQPLPPFTVNTADYYFLRVNTRTVFFYATYNLESVTFNMTAIQDQYHPMRSNIGQNVEVSRPFSSHGGSCIILSAECPGSTAVNMLMRDEIKRRVDIMLSPVIAGLFACILHLLVSCSVHCGYVHSTCTQE